MLEIAAISDEHLGSLSMIAVPQEGAGSGDGSCGRRRQEIDLMNDVGAGIQTAVDALSETGLGDDTSRLVARLRDQGLIKAESAVGYGGPGHRTKSCRPVQVNMSEKMFRQLKVIAATQGLSIKEQIIHALIQQGYTE